MNRRREVPNDLIREHSPYLREHAENPVDWQRWGPEAFEKARREDKPVFLSIGYFTCHWCHVMMRESFEDDEVARILNTDFVPVKVDREERPDVDQVYMRACQAMTGSGGWPLTAFLTADQTPFFVGTYFPKNSAHGRAGLTELLSAVGAAWKTDRESLLRSGQALADHLRSERAKPSGMTRALPQRAFEQLRRAFDPKWGGFGGAPKFPSPVTLLFLFRYCALEGETRALDMAVQTLEQMAAGGMFDHLGGGFCRYSTDRKWLVPHFEKMLYDNALLIMAYAQAYQITKRPYFREIAERIVDYLMREMRSPEGGFYAAQDADSEGLEGAYYALRPGEATDLLGEELGGRFNRAFGIDEAGDFEGGSVPNRLENGDPLDEALRGAVSRLYSYRRARRPLATDDKIMTEWNALLIGALAQASGAFGRPDLLEGALEARRFIKARMTRPDGLCAYYRDGRAVGRAHLNDYACLAWADLELYEATFDPSLISDAEALCGEMLARFYDAAQGDFFLGEANADLNFRTKEHGDNATPSGNSVAADVFLRLHALTGDEKWRSLSDKLLAAVAAQAAEYPAGCCFGLMTALRALYPSVRVACQSGDPGRIERFARLTGSMYLKNAVRAVETPGDSSGKTAYQLCQEGVCGLPIEEEARLPGALAEYACAAYRVET